MSEQRNMNETPVSAKQAYVPLINTASCCIT